MEPNYLSPCSQTPASGLYTEALHSTLYILSANSL